MFLIYRNQKLLCLRFLHLHVDMVIVCVCIHSYNQHMSSIKENISLEHRITVRHCATTVSSLWSGAKFKCLTAHTAKVQLDKQSMPMVAQFAQFRQNLTNNWHFFLPTIFIAPNGIQFSAKLFLCAVEHWTELGQLLVKQIFSHLLCTMAPPLHVTKRGGGGRVSIWVY